MALGKDKKNKAGNVVIENYGKTEPVPNGGFIATEPLINSNIGLNIGEVGPTVAADGSMGNIFEPNDPLGGLGGGNNTGGIFERYGETVPANMLTKDDGEKVQPVVGWLVCTKGSNVGREFRIHSGYNYVGSANGDIIIKGDDSISRERHMMISYDPKSRKFYVGPASGANIVYLNDEGLFGGAKQMKNYDVISTGDTSLMFIGFCGPEFSWDNV